MEMIEIKPQLQKEGTLHGQGPLGKARIVRYARGYAMPGDNPTDNRGPSHLQK